MHAESFGFVLGLFATFPATPTSGFFDHATGPISLALS